MTQNIPNIMVKRLTKNASIPSLGSELAAGLDLATVEHVTIPPGKRALLKTGLAMELPPGTVGLIWPRSKLAAKKGIDVLAGVVDADYRGEVMVSLLNTGEDPVELRAGDKVAQMIVQPYVSYFPILEVNELGDTQRGAEGVNSTDMRFRA